MKSSILQQVWNEQEKQRSAPLKSTCSIVPIINDQIANRSDFPSLKYSFQTNSEPGVLNSPNVVASSMTRKESCPIENDEEETKSFKRRLMAHLCSINCKIFSIASLIGGLICAIALATVLTMYIKDRSSSTIVSTSSTSETTSTSSTSETSTTSVTTTSTTSETTTAGICVNGDTAITFDDLICVAVVPNGYNNIDWTNAYCYTTTTNTSGYYTGIVSQNNTSFNPNGTPMTMTTANGSLFTLYSAAVAAAWYDNLQFTVVGYNSNVVIANNTFTLQVFTVSYLTFSGYSGLDTVVFSTSGGTQNSGAGGSGTQYAMDNICLTFT